MSENNCTGRTESVTTALYAAPMEGITGYIYRKTQAEFFGGIEKYYSPFITPNKKLNLRTRELNDVLPENNAGLSLVPQLMTNCAGDFLAAAAMLSDMGYGEVNLNLGCPSGTVTAKGKGAGFLARPEELRRFFDEVFAGAKVEISVKTRVGVNDEAEFPPLMEIFNDYPISLLIVHPRLRTDFYKGEVRLECYETATRLSRAPLCYNGDIFTAADFRRTGTLFPGTDCFMLGRGLIADPGLPGKITGKSYDISVYRNFHDCLLERYSALGYGDTNVLFKMKELWQYLSCNCRDRHKRLKAIGKAKTMADYRAAVNAAFGDFVSPEDFGYRGA